MEQLETKTALITGAKGGLGTYVTKTFLLAGANVVGVSRSIRQTDFPHPRFSAVPGELSSREAAQALASAVTSRFPRIDILVHLVGAFAGGAPVAGTDDATFERMLDLNLRSAFHILRAVTPMMRASGSDNPRRPSRSARVSPSRNSIERKSRSPTRVEAV